MPEWFGGGTLGSALGSVPSEHWKGQWQRVQRWHKKVQRIRVKAECSELDAFDFDDVVACLQNCYHLRDWLEASYPTLKPSLKTFFEQHFELGACRDVCNGYKHKAYKRPSHDAEFNFYREYDHFRQEIEPEHSPVRYRLAFADGKDLRKFDLFEFTETVFRLWTEFIATHLGPNC
jgi:hypothetical protein